MQKDIICPDCKINNVKIFSGRYAKKCLTCRNIQVRKYNQKYRPKSKTVSQKDPISCKRCNLKFIPVSINHKYCSDFCRGNIVSEAEKWLKKNPGNRNSRNKAFDSFKKSFHTNFVNNICRG